MQIYILLYKRKSPSSLTMTSVEAPSVVTVVQPPADEPAKDAEKETETNKLFGGHHEVNFGVPTMRSNNRPY